MLLCMMLVLYWPCQTDRMVSGLALAGSALAYFGHDPKHFPSALRTCSAHLTCGEGAERGLRFALSRRGLRCSRPERQRVLQGSSRTL
jgi:hypothetical protein